MRGIINSIKKVTMQLSYIMTKQQKKRAIWVFVTMVCSSLLELIGVSLILPFLEVMTSSENLKSKWYYAWIYAIKGDISQRELIIVMGIVFAITYLFKNLFLIYAAYVQNAYAAAFKRETSTSMLRNYTKREYEFFVNTNSAVIQRGVMSDVDGVYQIVNHIFTIITEIMTVSMIGVFLVYTDWVIAANSLLLALLCFLLIVFGFKKRIKVASRSARQAFLLRVKHIRQALSGIKDITVMDRKDIFVSCYEEAAKEEEVALRTKTFLEACPDRILEGICMSGFMLIVCAIVVVKPDDMSVYIPVLGTFAMGAFKMLPAISKVSSRTNQIVYFMPCLQCCYDNFYAAATSEDKAMSEQIDISDKSFESKLEIKSITWKYRNMKEPVLKDLTLTINRGEAVGLIGPSGAGKTTLSDVILGLLRPQQGSVEMDGIDVFRIPHKWAKTVGFVPQSVYLIDDTVRANIAFGLPESMTSDDDIWLALEQAQLKTFVQNLPNGLDTIVGERGVKFSGGQKQRIAIARALYNNPDILVLDEATSALDNETESAVVEAINSLQGTKTLIIVAHRLSTIANCDVIYEISDGVAKVKTKEELGIA